MSEKTLGVPFDIHTGGQDLLFPHHENELAQCCGVHNKLDDISSYARYWIHNGMIRFDGDKMSKSLGNIQFINDLLNDHNGETLRLVLMSTHYRQPLNWSAKTIDQSQKTLDRLYRIIKSLNISLDDTNVKPAQEVIDALCDDLNTPEALGQFNLLMKDLENVEGNQKEEKLAIIISTARMLGILQSDPDSWLGYQKVKTGMDIDKIEQMIEDRNNCRSEKNFQRADEIRDELRSMGIEIEDTAEGTIWKSEN